MLGALAISHVRLLVAQTPPDITRLGATSGPWPSFQHKVVNCSKNYQQHWPKVSLCLIFPSGIFCSIKEISIKKIFAT